MEKYEKIGSLASGTFGTVYLARQNDKPFSLPLVVKLIPLDVLTRLDKDASVSEAHVLSVLIHPNIIRLHDSFLTVDGTNLALVMEYAMGGTLYEVIEKRAANNDHWLEEDINHLFGQMVAALDFIHGQNVLHRDIKSQNIFLTHSLDHVKIGDFGISKVLASKSKAFSLVGTPCYISPELCEGKAYDKKSDVWSLGCILHEMCCLRRAFEAPNLPALVLKITKGQISKFPSGLYSQTLERLIQWLLALDPEERPSILQVMAHHWVAPSVLRLPATLGAIPCNSRNLTDKKRSPFLSRTPSPFLTNRRPCMAYVHERNSITSLPLIADESKIVQIGENASAITSSGKAIKWTKIGLDWKVDVDQTLNAVKVVSLCESSEVQCFLTDRGILMTRKAKERMSSLKIVEPLLCSEVTSVSCYGSQILCGTGDGTIYQWKGSEAPDAIKQFDHRIIDLEIGKDFKKVEFKDESIEKCFVLGKNSHGRFGKNDDENFQLLASNYKSLAIGNSISIWIDHGGRLFASGKMENEVIGLLSITKWCKLKADEDILLIVSEDEHYCSLLNLNSLTMTQVERDLDLDIDMKVSCIGILKSSGSIICYSKV